MLSGSPHQCELLGSWRCGLGVRKALFTESLRVAAWFLILGKTRASLMLIYGEFGTIARISKCFLINGGSIASVTHAWETLPFVVGESNSRGMELWSSIVSAGGSSEASGSALLDSCLWELCFSLVSPLWESCYSLASC